MISPSLGVAAQVIEHEHLQILLAALLDRDYQVIGPTVQDNAVVYAPLTSTKELPTGYTDKQEGGTYTLKKGGGQAAFGYTLSPQSWKRYLHKPELRLWQAQRKGDSFEIMPEDQTAEKEKLAFIGVRPCELRAIEIQDKVFIDGPYTDVHYQLRREQLCIIAVNCGQAGATCFCSSMQSGPRATAGFDLALTEILHNDSHYYVVEVGTPLGQELLETLPHRAATDEDLALAEQATQQAVQHMGRKMETAGLKDLLNANLEHPRWKEIATRCLSCGNCTMVCPTCFCTTVEDVNDLSGKRTERRRTWDSCFKVDFSYISGGSVRASVKSRYRQWMTHKLAAWEDQFGTSGCVGCGRCITWCPVGIDITEEVRVISETSSGPTTAKEQ
jgi:Fe-S oxidoreductase